MWLGFKGGKGVATYLGVLLGIHWPTMIIAALAWLATAFATRYSSLSALVASAWRRSCSVLFRQPEAAALCLVLTLLIWIRHHANLRRLIAGEESKIGGAK